jgi:hypothetical protein
MFRQVRDDSDLSVRLCDAFCPSSPRESSSSVGEAQVLVAVVSSPEDSVHINHSVCVTGHTSTCISLPLDPSLSQIASEHTNASLPRPVPSRPISVIVGRELGFGSTSTVNTAITNTTLANTQRQRPLRPQQLASCRGNGARG